MPIWQLCANMLIPNCLRFNLSYSPLAALELYVNRIAAAIFIFIVMEVNDSHHVRKNEKKAVCNQKKMYLCRR